ncbi:MAG: AraC family transcriptional regulator [Clostridiaceae bacterium]
MKKAFHDYCNNTKNIMRGMFFKKIVMFYIIIIFFCIMIMSLFFYNISFKNVKKQVVNSNMAILDNYSKTIDSLLFGNIENISMVITNDMLKSDELLYFSIHDYDNNLDNVLKVYAKLDAIKYVNPLIDIITLYYERNNMFISTNGMRCPDSVLRYELPDTETISRVYKENISQKWVYSPNVPKPPSQSSSKNESNLMIYVRKINSASLNSAWSGCVAISISTEMLLNTISNSSPVGFENNFILDENGLIIRPPFDNTLIDYFTNSEKIGKLADFRSPTGFIEFKYKGISYIASYITSKNNGWRFVTINPINTFMNSYNFLLYITIILASAVFLFGVILAVLSAFKTYKPLAHLVSICRSYDVSNIVYDNRECDFIISTLNNYNNIVNNQKKRIIETYPLIIHELILYFIESHQNKEKIEKKLDFLGLTFPYQYFQALEIRWPYLKGKMNLQELEYLEVSIINDLNSFFINMGIIIITTIKDDNIISIMNFEHNNDDNVVLIKKLISKLNEKYRVCIYCSTGSVVHGWINLADSFRESFQNIDYHYLYPQKALLLSSEISLKKIEPTRFESDLELLEQAMASYNAEKSISLIGEICGNIQKNPIPIEQVKKVLSLIVFQMESFINMHIEISNGLDDKDLYSSFKEIMDIEKFEKWASSLLDTAISLILSKHSQRNSEIIDKVKRYIENRISSEDISLKSIANSLFISHTYLSRIFKEETGYYFMDYILDIKMQKARELLICTGKKVDEIAYMLGYTTTPYFIKLFKCKFGSTPKQYRSLYNKDNKLQLHSDYTADYNTTLI